MLKEMKDIKRYMAKNNVIYISNQHELRNNDTFKYNYHADTLFNHLVSSIQEYIKHYNQCNKIQLKYLDNVQYNSRKRDIILYFSNINNKLTLLSMNTILNIK